MFKTVLLTIASVAVAAALAGAVVVYSGLYNVAATTQHTQFVYSLLETAMRQAVRLRSRDIEVPALDNERMVSQGAACFAQKCVQCHGAPGVAQGDIGQSLQPLPGPLSDASARWKPEQLYWITRHGIRMSGMPAWEFRLDESELWALVAFMQKLPDLTPQQYLAVSRGWTGSKVAAEGGGEAVSMGAAACGLGLVASSKSTAVDSPAPAPMQRPQGNVDQGLRAMYQYACSACHTIPGVVGSSPNVGPPLAGIASRSTIAGRLPNTHENMVRWLMHTRQVDPLTAMPDLGVTEAHANDMAAFLATLK